MQILQWLFKEAQEEKPKETTPSNNKQKASTAQKPDCKDLVLYKRNGIYQRCERVEECETKKCFYDTLNLKILGSFRKNNHWLHEVIIKEEGLAQELCMGHKGDTAAHAGNKVLPLISNATVPTVAANDQCSSSEKKDKPNGDKIKAISRMKELLRWAAAAKAEKGGRYIRRKVLCFRNRGALKAEAHDNDSNLSSPKISFKWDVGSCSTSSSAYSGFSSFTSSSTITDRTQIKPIISSAAEDVSVSVPDSTAKKATTSSQDSELCNTRRGNWITTDDEFVVLEL